MTQQVPDKINVFWFLPTHGDGRYLGTTEGGRPVDLPYLQQVALAADSLGYYGVLIPTGKSCEDSWLVASALAPLTRRLRYLVAVRPGLQPPTLAARMAATLDRLSEGRLLINVVTGGDPVENKGDGIFLSHSERYQVTREFLDVYSRLLRGEKVDYHGEHIHVEGAEVLFPPVQENGPPLYFGGSSEAAIDVAAEQIDSYLTWGEPPELVAEKLAKNTRLYKAVAACGKTAVIDCAPLKRYELPRTVRSMAVTHGVTLTEGAAVKLVDLVGEDTVHLDSELKKIALAHRGTDAVNEHEIVDMVSRTAEVKPWEFVDAFAARDVRKCLLYLGRMDSVSPHALLAMCTTRLRELVCARSMADRGNPRGVAAALKAPDWRVKNHVNWARGFTAAELRRAIISSRDTERAMKSGADPRSAFLDWVLAVTARR